MTLILREAIAPFLALFTSLSTLLCCALPALLITIGAGAVMAGLVSTMPGLIWLTERKEMMFAIAGIMLTISIAIKWFTRNAPCPVNPAQAQLCMRMRKAGTMMLAVAVIAYLTGGFFAFFAADLLL